MGWNGTKISVWDMEDARMEWNGRFQEWNGRQSSILPNQFQTRFYALHLQKNMHGCRVVINNIVAEVFHFNIYAYYLSTNRGTLVVFIAHTVNALHHSNYIAICSTDIMVDDFNRFDMFFSCRDRQFTKSYFFFLPSPKKCLFANWYFIPVSA